MTNACPIARRPRIAVYWPMLLKLLQSNHCRGFQRLNRTNIKMQPTIIPASVRLSNFRISPVGRYRIIYRDTRTPGLSPGGLFFLGLFANDVFDEFYPLINVVCVDDDRSGYDVGQRMHPHFLVKVKNLHRKISLKPETLTVRGQDFSLL